MPQSTDIYNEALVDVNPWKLLRPKDLDVGSGMGISHCYPEYARVYNYECYSGSSMSGSWCPVAEANFSRLMAFAASIRWDLMINEELVEKLTLILKSTIQLDRAFLSISQLDYAIVLKYLRVEWLQREYVYRAFTAP